MFTVELTSDCDALKVKVRQLGSHPCMVNGKDLAAGQTSSLKNGDSLFILRDKYENVIRFSGASSTGSDLVDATTPKSKRKISTSDSSEQSPTKRAKLSNHQVVCSSKATANNGSESDSEHERQVRERLEVLKKHLKDAPVTDKLPDNSDNRNNKPVPTSVSIRKPMPTSKATWDLKESLMVFTSKGVVACTKVFCCFCTVSRDDHG